jgi:hypothetical protein
MAVLVSWGLKDEVGWKRFLGGGDIVSNWVLGVSLSILPFVLFVFSPGLGFFCFDCMCFASLLD